MTVALSSVQDVYATRENSNETGFLKGTPIVDFPLIDHASLLNLSVFILSLSLSLLPPSPYSSASPG